MENGRSIGELLTDLSQETRLLVQQEITLVKKEVGEKISQMERGATQVAIGSAMLYAGMLALVATAIIALGLVLEWWLAALIVGVLVCALGFSVLARGREQLKPRNLELRRTRHSLKEDQNLVRDVVR